MKIETKKLEITEYDMVLISTLTIRINNVVKFRTTPISYKTPKDEHYYKVIDVNYESCELLLVCLTDNDLVEYEESGIKKLRYRTTYQVHYSDVEKIPEEQIFKK